MEAKDKMDELFSKFQADFKDGTDAYYIQKTDMDRVGEMISGTFADDPGVNYLLGDVSKKAHVKYCRTAYKSMFGDSIMISSDKDINNLVVLCAPGYKGIPTLRFLMSGGIGTILGIGAGAIKRSIAFESNCVDIRNRFSDDKTLYLMTFAVREGMTGQGLGYKILQPVLEWMDKNGYSVYLETHKAVNVDIYKSFGFQLVDTCMVPGSQVKQYGMLRSAKQIK